MGLYSLEQCVDYFLFHTRNWIRAAFNIQYLLSFRSCHWCGPTEGELPSAPSQEERHLHLPYSCRHPDGHGQHDNQQEHRFTALQQKFPRMAGCWKMIGWHSVEHKCSFPELIDKIKILLFFFFSIRCCASYFIHIFNSTSVLFTMLTSAVLSTVLCNVSSVRFNVKMHCTVFFPPCSLDVTRCAGYAI